MRYPRADLIGRTFGRLTVMGDGVRTSKGIAWRCRCACGNEVDVLGYNLGGNTTSCGKGPPGSACDRMRGCRDFQARRKT